MTTRHEQFEIEHRFCPICDEEIFPGDPFHYCDENRLMKLELEALQQELMSEVEEVEPERLYGDKLTESEEIYDNEKYYEIEDDEQ